jgi:hypothetical protein
MAITGKWWNPKIFVGGYEFSPDLNNAVLNYGNEVLDATRFGHETKVNAAGLRTISLECSGFANLADNAQDEVNAVTNIDTNTIPVSVFPTNTPAVGDVARFFEANQSLYSVGGPVGQILPFNFNLSNGASGYPCGIGYVLEPGITAKTGTGSTAGTNNPGAVAADEYVYAILHVTEVSAGDDITVIVESDDNAGFTSATTRVSFALTAVTGGWLATRVAGAITDDYWRTSHTCNGADISIKYACAIAVAGA